jgi:hypothetical protein
MCFHIILYFRNDKNIKICFTCASHLHYYEIQYLNELQIITK